MKPTQTPVQALDAIGQASIQPGALSRLEDSSALVTHRPLERWAGLGFILGGLVIGAAITVQLMVGQGYHFPTFVFQSFRTLGPIAFIGAAAGGFILGRSRLARWLSISTIGFMAVQEGWDRFLPSISWTAPRFLLAIVLVLGGLRLITKPSKSPSAAV